MLNILPDELNRKILSQLQPKHIKIINPTCKDISRLKFNRLIIPWVLENCYNMNNINVSIDDHKYICTFPFERNIDILYDYIESLNIIIGDFCKWDYWTINSKQNDTYYHIYTPYLERKMFKKINNVSYHKYANIFSKSLQIRALVF